jgi:predicted nucleic acid-binding protein
MVLIDTSVWIDYLRGTINPHTDWIDRELSLQRLGLTDLILCEILQGIPEDAAFRKVRRTLSQFEIFSTGGEDLAVASAVNYRRLRAGGHTIRKTIDCLIATFCVANGHTLLHRDRNFDLFEAHLRLRVIHP